MEGGVHGVHWMEGGLCGKEGGVCGMEGGVNVMG